MIDRETFIKLLTDFKCKVDELDIVQFNDREKKALQKIKSILNEEIPKLISEINNDNPSACGLNDINEQYIWPLSTLINTFSETCEETPNIKLPRTRRDVSQMLGAYGEVLTKKSYKASRLTASLTTLVSNLENQIAEKRVEISIESTAQSLSQTESQKPEPKQLLNKPSMAFLSSSGQHNTQEMERVKE